MSAAPGIFTVQTALLAGGGASDLLLPTAPLGEMHGDAAGAELARRGAEISLGPGSRPSTSSTRTGSSSRYRRPRARALLGEPDPGSRTRPS